MTLFASSIFLSITSWMFDNFWASLDKRQNRLIVKLNMCFLVNVFAASSHCQSPTENSQLKAVCHPCAITAESSCCECSKTLLAAFFILVKKKAGSNTQLNRKCCIIGMWQYPESILLKSHATSPHETNPRSFHFHLFFHRKPTNLGFTIFTS